MHGFLFSTTRSLLCEPGGARRLASICRDYAARQVLLVTDAGIARAGLLETVLANFADAQVAVRVFDGVESDPSDRTVLRASDVARRGGVDMVIGLGGGSVLDVAKLVAVLASPECRQLLPEIYGTGQVAGGRLPLIQVPTTAGTGSEVTPIAVVTTADSQKSAVVSPVLLPDMAVLDPELTLGLPPAITAATGVDAMVHAIEAYTSRICKNPLSDLLAREALRLLSANLSAVFREGQDLERRRAMQLGAMLAGQAFANAPVAAVHALAYPLGGRFHVPHGVANALMLPHVLRFNAAVAAPLYAELAPLVAGPAPAGPGRESRSTTSGGTAQAECQRLIMALEQLIREVGLPTQLRDLEIPLSALPLLAREALGQQRLLENNPRVLAEADALALYRAAY